MMAERKFHGVKAAVGEMRGCNRYDGTHFHSSFGGNSWTVYHDSAVIPVGTYSSPVKMAELKEDIRRAIANQEEVA